MTKVIGVRFKTSARVYYFDPLELEIHAGDGVIVETARGQEFGVASQGVTEVEESAIVAPLKPVVRVATEEDKRMREQYAAREKDAFETCQKKIEQHKLDMKLVDVEYTFNGSKVVFYFTADERVDFRELVKDLASCFRTRIELRQIGVRDEAKMLGGLGSCGRPVCCKTFLDDFRPVSIRMAKEQNLSLSPTKISGLCGRLMCCLQYEQSAYEEMRKKMPKTGREIATPDGVGIAIENNAVTEKTRVRLTLPDGTIEVREYHYTQLAKPGEPLPVVELPKPVPKEPVFAAAVAYVAPETPGTESSVSPAEPVGDAPRKRRRRGGKGRGNGGGRPTEGGAQPPSGNGSAPVSAPAPSPVADEASGEPKAPAKKRRRRGGAGRNRTGAKPAGETGAPAGDGE